MVISGMLSPRAVLKAKKPAVNRKAVNSNHAMLVGHAVTIEADTVETILV